jgi:hypothetical protein
MMAKKVSELHAVHARKALRLLMKGVLQIAVKHPDWNRFGSTVRRAAIDSLMATKRRRRHRPDQKTVEHTDGFPQWEHGAFTVEGEIERLGGISRGLSTAPRWARLVARGVALIVLLPLAIGLISFLVGLVTH